MHTRLLILLLLISSTASATKVCELFLSPRARVIELNRLYQLKLKDVGPFDAVMGVNEAGLESLIATGMIAQDVALPFVPLKYIPRSEAIRRARCDARAQSIYATLRRHLAARRVTTEGHILLYALAHLIAEETTPEPKETNFTVVPEVLYPMIAKLPIAGRNPQDRLRYLATNLGVRSRNINNRDSDDAFIFEHLFCKLPLNSGFIIGLRSSAVSAFQNQAYPVLPQVRIEDLSGLKGINPTNNGSLDLILVQH